MSTSQTIPVTPFNPLEAPLIAGEDTTLVGPRLSDADFFGQHLDTTRPGLEGIPAAVAQGDYTTARRLFAAEVRATLQPERFLTVKREFRGLHFMYPDETVEAAAERILRLELISSSTPHQFEGEVDWFLNPTFNQYREWTWQLSRHPEWAILAERYRATGDERFAEGFVKFFRSWVRQAVVPEPIPGNATLCWRTIEAGIRMGGPWQWALHSFYQSPHFTDDDLVDWYKSIWEHAWRLRNFHRTHNWFIMEMNGLGQIALLYPQFKAVAEWKEYAFAGLIRELENQVYPDGVQFELSTGYHQVVIRNYEWLWDVYAAYDQPVPQVFSDRLEQMHTVNVGMMMPDGRLPDLNDGRWAPVADLVKRAVNRHPDRQDFRWASSEGRAGTPPETSLAFPYAGWFVMRTGWQPDAVWAYFDGGPFGFAHQHEDKLSLLLHAYGRLLLTEAGNYAYDTSEMRKYVLSTRAHNTIRVDGQDQNRRLTLNRDVVDLSHPAPATWRTTDSYDLAEAEYDEGYGPEAKRTVRHHRRVIFLKPGYAGLAPCLLVIDRLVPRDDASHAYDVLWHLDVDQVAVEGVTVNSRDEGQANLALLPSNVSDLGVEIVKGQETPEWQGWHGRTSYQGQFEPIPTAIYHLQASGPVRLVTLLYPTPPSATCPVTSVAASADPNDTEITLTLSDGQTVSLDETM